LKYGVVLLDPPWTFHTRSKVGQNRSAENHYQCMSLQDIFDMPLLPVCADNCLLLLWVTRPHLENGLEFIRRIGKKPSGKPEFTYSTMVDWAKIKDGKLQTGTGYRARDSSEVLLIATRGTVKLQPPAYRQPSVIIHPRTRHSEKPPQQYLYARGVSGPCLEVFARVRRSYSDMPPGMNDWTFIGQEITGNDVRIDLERLAKSSY